MSSAVFPTSAAQGRPFIFDVEAAVPVQGLGKTRTQPTGAELFGEARPPQRVTVEKFNGGLLKGAGKDARLASVIPASRLAVHPAPEMVSSGITDMDVLTGGLPRGCLTEICGPASSGRTTLLLAALASATRRGEFCAVIDAGDALDPQSVAAAGVDWDRLLWVRCGENSQHADRLAEKSMEQLLRAADLLLESGGFGLIALDLADLSPQSARRIPLTTWFRFRRAVEHTPTVLLAIERQSIAGSCSSLLIKLGAAGKPPSDARMDSESPLPTHAQLLTELEITAEIARSRMDRKPARSAEVTFTSKTAWAG
jgi:hypothetical protein